MRIFKKVLFILLLVIDAYLLYASIGYLIWAENTPKIFGESNTVFFGMYIMCIVAFSLFFILTIILVVWIIRFRNQKARYNKLKVNEYKEK